MNDTFYELLVKKNKPEFRAIILSGITIATAVFLLLLSFTIPFAMIPAIIIFFFFYYFVYPQISVEYEYSLLNADLTVDAIYNKTKRKSLLNLDLKTLETAFPASSPKMLGKRNAKILDYSTGNLNESYCLILSNNGENIALLISPDDRMVDMIKHVAPRAFM